MLWLDRSKDLLAVAIATVAVILSLIAVVIQRRQQQRTAYQQIQEVLMSEDVQRGRWMVSEISWGRREFPEPFTSDYYLINRTIGVCNTLAMYVRRKMVPRSWVLDMWHHALADMASATHELARRHQAEMGYRPWAELWSLLDEAARYKSTLTCCSSPRDLTGKAEKPA